MHNINSKKKTQKGMYQHSLPPLHRGWT